MIEVEVEDLAWTSALPTAAAVVERAARTALGRVQGDVVVLLTDDTTIRDLNARFRDKDKPTNVLSFPAAESALPHLGDLVLAYGVCVQEARDQGKSLADHLTHLTVHGVLHLLGRDHEDDGEAEEMETEERSILASLGVADPYGTHEHPDGDG
jgi:probable rRNA maturation factor